MNATDAYKIHLQQAQKVAKIFSINPYELAKYAFAVNKVENRQFNENAKNSSSSARGMMQMLSGTQQELETKYLKTQFTPNKIFDPEYAVFLGQYELARQLKRYKMDWRKAIHAYNRGSVGKSNSKSYAAGENYANNVLNTLNSIDYASLNKEIGSDTVATNGTYSNISLNQEWA